MSAAEPPVVPVLPPGFVPPSSERPELLPASGVLTVTSLTLDGVAIPLAGVVADVTIRHGRAGYFDAASPSTAQITLIGVTRSLTRPLRLGALLVVNATDGATVAPRFTGRLTDGDLAGDVLTLIAVGRLRTLSGYKVGTVDYPEEVWSARVTRAFAEAGLVPATNLHTNGDHDDPNNGAVWGWGSGNTMVEVNPPQPVHKGRASVKCTVSGTDGNLLFQGIVIPVAGEYRASAWVWIAAAFVGSRIHIDVSASTAQWPIPADMTKRDQWQQISTTFTANAGDVWTVVWATGAALGGVVYVDTNATASAASDVLELVVGPSDPLLLARPAEPVSLDSYLGELVDTVESAVADRPDGRILVQAITARTLAGSIALDPAEVAYSPAWEIRLPAANVVAIEYGEPAAKVTVSDAASVALYGPIEATITTDLTTATDATTAANGRLGRGSYAHWTTPATVLLVGRRLPIGSPVGLPGLPAAPFPSWSPILEGWTDTIVSDGAELVWTMDLALSDPLLSGLTLSWQAVPVDAAHHWNTINQAVAWRDALVLSDLDP